MSVIPCARDPRLQEQVERFAEVLKTEAHKLGDHGLDEKAFYESPLFRGAIERVRGQFSATMRGKREFVQHVLNHMQDGGFIAEWDQTGSGARNDYVVRLLSGRTAVIDLKGCLDGNNTTISERPPDADEFVVWSLCTNLGADPRRNAWSGVHTRLSADMIARGRQIDGLIVWDMVCGTSGRPCPKLARDPGDTRRTAIGPFSTPPACIYLFPDTLPVENGPSVAAQRLDAVELLSAFHACFKGQDDEINHVNFALQRIDGQLRRSTRVERGGIVQHASGWTPIRRAEPAGE